MLENLYVRYFISSLKNEKFSKRLHETLVLETEKHGIKESFHKGKRY